MRLFSIIAAILVTAALYAFVFERDRIMEFAGSTPAEGPAAPQNAVIAAAQGVPADRPADMPVGVSVVAIHSTAAAIESAVVLRGQTAAARQVTVAAETGGRIASEPLRKGSLVDAGSVLCTIDAGTREATLAEARARLDEARGRVPEAQASVTEAQARVREAEINLNAAQALSQDGFASETRVVGARAAMESASAGVQRAQSGVIAAQAGISAAQATIAAIERDIAQLVITAPFAGLLETDTAELGTLMQPGAPCATVIQLDPIRLVGFVPEAEVGRIAIGAPARARLSNLRDVTGDVTFLSRSADPITRTFRVEVTVANPDLTISDGQTAEIVVATDAATAHLVPQSALTLNDDGALGVRVVSADMTAQFLPVTLLRDTADGVWITNIPAQIDIITVGQEFVTEGTAVVPTYREDTL